MDVRHLDLLRELADRDSITAVAEATHRTVSAVSQQLKAAQRQAGMALVEHHGRGLRLTDAGRVLAEAGAEVGTAIAAAEARWDAFRAHPTGTVGLAMLPSAAAVLLPRTLRAAHAEGIEVVCHDADIAEAQFAELTLDHDVVVAHSLSGPRPASTEGLTVVPLAREPIDVAVAADHPLAAAETVTAAQAAAYPWYGVPRDYPFDTVLQEIARAAGAELQILQRLRDNRLMEALVADGSGLALLPRFTSPMTATTTLRPLADVDARRHISAIMRPDRAERLAVRRVIEALHDAGAEAEGRHGDGA